MSIQDIAQELKDADQNLQVIYAFNSTGKTQLSVAYKDATKNEKNQHAGVYYNSNSEDLFSWDSGDNNNENEIRLNLQESSLSIYHGSINEDDIKEHLNRYNPTYVFRLILHDNPERGIQFIRFYSEDSDPDEADPIKISRGEERTFVWCFFLALFALEDFSGAQPDHFFIDDPVSSLDDHNVYITASTIFDIIENYYKERKIIVTTHHVGLFSILSDWLKKGEKSARYKDHTKLAILTNRSGEVALEACRKDVFLYHLRLLQILEQARDRDDLRSFHLALLRQALENISSFLGVGRINYVLTQIGVDDPQRVASIVNSLSHKNVDYYETDDLAPDNEALLIDILDKLKSKYNFVLHA
jgi:hypothetical protein